MRVIRRDSHWQLSSIYLVICPTENFWDGIITLTVVCVCVGTWEHDLSAFSFPLFVSFLLYLILPIPLSNSLLFLWSNTSDCCGCADKASWRITAWIEKKKKFKINFTFLKSRVQSLAFSPNCHLHCVSASYNSPGNFSGYWYSLTALGSSERQKAWAVLGGRRGDKKEK